MFRLVEFPLDGGGSVRVEVEPGDGVGQAGVGKLPVSPQTLQKALEPIRPIAQGVLEKLRDLAESPSQVSIEFGVKLSAEGGIVLARGTAEVNFTVRLGWDRPTGSDR